MTRPRPGSSAPTPGPRPAAPGASPATAPPRRTTPSGRAAGPSPPARRRSPPRAGRAARPAAPARSSGPPGCRRRPGRWSVRRRSTRSGGRGARATAARCGPRASRLRGPRSPSPWAATKADSRVWPRPSSCRKSSRSTVSIRCPSRAACWTKSRRASNWCWALRAACSGVMIMARSPGCGLIGCVETDVLPQRGLAFNCLPPQLLVSKRSPGERAAGYAQFKRRTRPVLTVERWHRWA